MRRAMAMVIVLVAAVVSLLAHAQEGVYDLGGPLDGLSEATVRVRAAAPGPQVPAGSEATVELTFSCAPGHYLWHDSIKVSLAGDADGLRAGALELPEPKQKYDEFTEGQVKYQDGEFTARLRVAASPDASPGERALTLDVRYTECGPDLCRFGSSRVPVSLTVLPRGRGAPAPAEPPAPVPERGPGDVPTGEFVAFEDAPAGADAFSERAPLVAVLLAFVAGIGLALTPCVYPLIPITVSLVGATADGRRLSGLVRSLVYVLGISVTYSAVGLAAAATGGMFGAWLQHPAVYLALAVLFVVLAGGMFGIYSLDVSSQRLQRLQAGLRGRAGLLGIFVIGLLSGAAATACIAPVIIGVLGYVAQRGSLLLGFLMFFAMAWGMGLPLVVLGTFTGLVAALPKSGEWMAVVKRLFGLALLGAAAYFVGKSGLLPDTWFKVLVALLLLAAAVFVGAFDFLSPEEGWRSRLRKTAAMLLLAGGLLAFFSAVGVPFGPAAENGVQWVESEPEALAQAAAERKPVLLDFWADWCAPCKRMLKTTFADARVVEESRRFVMAKIDVGSPEGGEQARILEKYAVRGAPTVVLIGAGGRRRSYVGYVGPDEMLAAMQAVK